MTYAGRLAGTRCWWKVNSWGSLGSMVALTQWYWYSPKVVTRVKFSMTFGPGLPAAFVVAKSVSGLSCSKPPRRT